VVRSVVIGGNGFVGSHLVDALAREGHQVTAFDRFGSRRAAYVSPGVRALQGDFLSRSDIEEAVRDQDMVFHFLSTTNPATAQSDPTLDIRTNVAQTVELLEASVAHGVHRFFFASTGGAIYGSQGKEEYREADRTHPVSPYAIGKLTIENYLRYFHIMHGLSSTALRISNPFGPRQGPDRRQGLIPIALRQISRAAPVERFGDGSMVRDYLYVEDLVAMIARMVGREPEHMVYNLGSGAGRSVNEIFAAIERVVGGPFDIRESAAPPTFVDRVVLDTARFAEEFGMPQLTTLEDGIQKTYLEIENE